MLQQDMANMKMDTFRAEFMGLNMGIPCNFISYTKEGFTMRLIAGISLQHNVYPRPIVYEDLDFSEKIWKIYDDFQVTEATWHPYWEQKELVAEGNTYLSYYTKDDETLLLVTSLNKGVDKLTVTLDKAYGRILDLLDEDEACIICGNKAEIPVAYCDIKICKLIK